jgi:hypothetical protein
MKYINLKDQTVIEKEDDDASLSDSVVPIDDTVEMWSYEKRAPERVHADDVPVKVANDSHAFMEGTKVPVFRDEMDGVEEVDALTAQNMVQLDGARVARPSEAKKIFMERKYGTAGQEVTTALERFGSGFTGGLSEIAAVKIDGKKIEDIEGREETNPIIAGTAELAGTVTGLWGAAGKGISALVKGAETLIPRTVTKKSIQTIGKNATKSMTRAGRYATTAVAEAGMLSAADNAKDAILHDEDLSLESMWAQAKPNMLISGAVGSVAGAAAPHVAKQVRAWSKDTAGMLDRARKAAGIEDGKVEAIIELRKLRKTRSPYNREKFGVEFVKDAEVPGAYTYRDDLREVVLDPAKIPGQILDFNNPNSVDEVITNIAGDARVKHMVGPKGLKTDFAKEVGDALKGVTDVDDETIKFLAGRKETRALGNALSRRADVLKMIEAGEIPSEASLRTARDAFEESQKFLSAWKPIRGQSYMNSLVKTVKQDEARHLARMVNIKEGAKAIDAFIDGDSLIFYNRSTIPASAVMKGFEFRPKGATPVKRDLVSILRAFGASKTDIDGFTASFSEAEHEVVGKYIADKLDQTGKWRMGPSLERLKEVMAEDRFQSLKDMTFSVDSLQDKLFRKYKNSAPARTGLTGSSVRNYIKNNLVKGLTNKVTGEPLPGNEAAIQKLMDYADSWVKSSTVGGREIPYTLDEWRYLRMNLDSGIYNSFERLPFPKSRLVELRNWMENKIISKAEELLPPAEVVDDVQKYIDGKRVYRLTLDGEDSISLFNIVENGAAKSAIKHGITRGDIVVGGSLGILGGGPGAIAGLALSAGGRVLKDNQDYMAYLYQKNVLPKIEKTFRSMNSGALEFSRLYGHRVSIGAQSLYITDQDISYLEKNKDRIEASLSAPEAYSTSANESAPELNVLKDGLGTKLAEKGHNALAFIYGKMPKSPYPNHAALEWKPTPVQTMQFKRYVNAVLYPETIFKNFGQGYISNEEIEVLKTVYPAMYNRFKGMVGEKTMGKPLSMDQKALLKRVFGAELAYLPPSQAQLSAGAAEEEQAEQEQAKKSKVRQSTRKVSGQQQTENERLLDK